MGKQAEAIGKRLHQEIAQACKMLVLEIDRQLRRDTPVDTGHARRNWVPSVGQPYTGTNGEAAHDAGVAAVLRHDGLVPLWVSNNTPYITRLNYGHSQQQPAGFVERAVALALQTIEQKFAAKNIDVSDLTGRARSEMGAAAAGNMASAYSPFGGDE